MGMTLKNHSVQSALSKIQRQDSLRERILRGVTNQRSLAAAYGVSQKTISLDMNEIYDQIFAESLQDHLVLKAFRIKQFENIGLMALNEYERSKKDIEEKAIVTKQCPNCFGLGKIEDSPNEFTPCGTCKATGKIKSEETIRIKQQIGDPAFMRVAKECISEISRIEGHYPRFSSAYSRRLEIEAEGVGGKINLKVQELFIEADSDLIIKCVSALDELQESLKQGSAKVIEAEHKRLEE